MSLDEVLATARDAAAEPPPVGAAHYVAFAREVGEAIIRRWPEVVAANALDVAVATGRGMTDALLERIGLGPGHRDRLATLAGEVAATVPGLATVGPAPRTVGEMVIRRVPRPLGVVAFVYEARPTVTVEGALLAACAGNAVVLRGGREIRETNRCLSGVLSDALVAAGLPAGLVQVLDDGDRGLFRELLTRRDAVDVLIPRGSPSLIDYCRSHSTIPVIASGGGANHLYVHASADPRQAAAIAWDSKLAVPTACNTVEMVLADRSVATEVVAALARSAVGTGATLRVPPDVAADRDGFGGGTGGGGVRVEPLGEHDDGREFLDRTIAVRPVDGLDAAVGHIRRYGSGHTEGIVATDPAAVRRFCARVDAAAIVVNGSLRLHDGPTMRLGPELSISTGRLHVRGPVGIASMLTYAWVIDGHGTLRDRLADAVGTGASRGG